MEQINHRQVQRILEFIQTSGSSLVITIQENISDLAKLAVEAADNAIFSGCIGTSSSNNQCWFAFFHDYSSSISRRWNENGLNRITTLK